ncbi:MAG: SIMPL domain-containing protein [Acidobacteria bacterium]|nr:SIMPL domain-containing protein [Acidobacteriota bacterium]
MRLIPRLCLFGLLLAALTPCAAAQDRSAPPLITVSGQAELRVQPDEAVLSLEVEKLDKDINVARQQADDSVAQILALARRNGVPQQGVMTNYITVGMKYSTDLVDDSDDEDAKKVKREFVGYEVSKSVTVRLTDLARFEGFFAEVLKAGVSRVRGVTFYTSQLRKYRDQARAAAIRAAREKAVALSAEVGQTIGKAYKISEEDPSRGSAMSNSVSYIPGNYSSDESSAFAPGTIAVSANVTVSFILN